MSKQPKQSSAASTKLQQQGYHLTIRPQATNSYSVSIGDLTNDANHDGLYYGTRTLLQILKIAASSHQLPLVDFKDQPITQERYLMIDVARRYFSVKTLSNVIRAMSYYKLNMLHLHFTDWSGFRLNDTANYPGLAPTSADESYHDLAPGDEPNYTQEKVKKLLQLAEQYHVSIVPEIDVPAHASALVNYYKTPIRVKASIFLKKFRTIYVKA